MADEIENVLICQKPAVQTAPLVLDSPHSGHIYPPDFGTSCPQDWLDETEDAFVDELFGDAPSLGVPLLSALFPRCYIDVNRAIDDIDPALLDRPHAGLRPTPRSGLGLGLIRRLHKQSRPEPLYDRKLTMAEINARIENYYLPYHESLEKLLAETFSAFGVVFHLNCHSMPGNSGAGADFVLGDRDGTTCDSSFTRFAAQRLRSRGYRVAINRPYKGVEIVQRYGRPADGWHSLQLEIRRGLYMDEAAHARSAGFDKTRADLAWLVGELAGFTRQNTAELAAD